MPLSVIREGSALVYIWDTREAVAGGRIEPAWLPVFYNPVMEFNRDLSVAALRAYTSLYAPHRPVVVEPLSASGVRAVRYALEADVERVIANDIDENAVRLIELNASLNGVEGVVDVRRGDANALMHALKAERTPVLVVDLDPYGSPAPFLDAALSLIGNRGLLAMTATDLAVLEGSKPRPALRRYMARVWPTPQSKEVAVRVLLGYTARVAAAHDKAIEPLLAYYADHYVRVYVLVRRGAKAADKMLSRMLGRVIYCIGSGYALMGRGPSCPEPGLYIAVEPAWVGPLFKREFVEAVARELGAIEASTRERGLKLLGTILEEEPLQHYIHQRVDALCSAMKVSMPRMESLLAELRASGYRASRTHFSPIGVRTDAGYAVLRSVLARVTPRPVGSA